MTSVWFLKVRACSRAAPRHLRVPVPFLQRRVTLALLRAGAPGRARLAALRFKYAGALFELIPSSRRFALSSECFAFAIRHRLGLNMGVGFDYNTKIADLFAKSGLAANIAGLVAKCASKDDDEALAGLAAAKALADVPEADAFTKECLTACKLLCSRL